MKKLMPLLCAVFLLLGGIGISSAAPVMVWDGVGGIWSDVNKTSVTGDPDSLMCWAAAASNVLDWTGWPGLRPDGTTRIATAADIYAEFDAGWNNREGSANFAYEWWMTDRTESIIEDPPGSGISEYTFDSPGLNFYPGVNVQEGGGSVTAFVKEDGSDTIYTWLGTYVNDNRGIVASIDVPDGPGLIGPYSHSVTVWGWDTVANEIYLTDSDDGVTALQTFNFYQSGGEMYIDDYTNLYTNATDVPITQLVRLNRNDPPIDPTSPNGQGVPEPATMALVGMGLLGLALFKSKE